MNPILDVVIAILMAHFPEHQPHAAEIAELVFCSAEQRAKAMAREAIAGLVNVGIHPTELPQHEFLAFAARLQLEKLCALGLMRHGQFKTLAADTDEHLASAYGASTTKERRNMAFFVNVCLFLEQAFSPLRKMLVTLIASGSLGENPEKKFITNKPFSEDALKRLGSLAKINFANIKTRPEIIIPRTIDDLMREIRVTEPEAARLIRKSPKTLADRRRGGRIPRHLFVQDAKDGNVYYIVKNLLKYIENEQATVKPAIKRGG